MLFLLTIGSVAFTEGGRYRGDGNYGKKLYGAFTGPMYV